MCSLYVQNFGIRNKLTLYVLQVFPSEVETEVRKGELTMNRQQATSGMVVSRFFHAKTVATSSDASHPIKQIITVRTDIRSAFSAAQLELSSAHYLGRLPSRIPISNYASCVTRIYGDLIGSNRFLLVAENLGRCTQTVFPRPSPRPHIACAFVS